MDHILSDLSTMTRPSWVAPRAWLIFIELDKAVVRKGGGEEIPLFQGKEQRLRFAGSSHEEIPHTQGKRNHRERKTNYIQLWSSIALVTRTFFLQSFFMIIK